LKGGLHLQAKENPKYLNNAWTGEYFKSKKTHHHTIR
jgi:hypothetical protein